MRLSVAFVLVTLTLGCAKDMVWNKPGSTQQDFNVDNYSCERDTRQSGYFGGGIMGEMNMRAFYRRCMVAKGWTLRED